MHKFAYYYKSDADSTENVEKIINLILLKHFYFIIKL